MLKTPACCCLRQRRMHLNRQPLAGEDVFRQERQFGRWARTVTLPDRVETEKVAASFKNGILTVTLPKSEAARPRQISVTAQTA